MAPDEFFFQTLIMNSEYAEKIVPSLMFIKAGKTFGAKNHPLIISEEFIDEIDTGLYFSARKFDMEKSKSSFQYYLDKATDGYCHYE